MQSSYFVASISCLKTISKLCLLLFLVLYFCILPSNVSATTNTDSMMAYWKLDGNLTDSSNHGNTGIINGAVTYSTNRPNTAFSNSQCAQFSGVSSYIQVSNQPGLQPTNAVTLTSWVSLSAIPTTTSVIAGNYASANPNYGYYFSITTSTVSFNIGNGSTVKTVSFPVSQLPVSTWASLIGTWDGSTVNIYLNGNLKASSSLTEGNINYASTSFTLGKFYGKLDDVRLYNRALSSQEILDLASGKHTMATWIGTSSNYENVSNWNIHAIPDAYTKIVIDASSTSNQPVFSASESMAALTLGLGASLTLSGYNLTLTDNGEFINNGTLILTNSETLSNFSNDIDSGTVEISSTTASTGLKTGSQYFNLKINNSPDIITTLSGNLNVYNDLSLVRGKLNASNNSYNIYIKNNWTKTGGEFQPGNSTVIFNGGDQNIYGSNTFWNLTKLPLLNSLYIFDRFGFEQNQTQTISNALNIQGATSHLINLRSTNPGTQWAINPQGTRTLLNLDVKDSNNVSGTDINVLGLNILSSGNNTHWTFNTTPPTISLAPIKSPTAIAKPPILGTASKTTATISKVEYQLDNQTSDWLPCQLTSGNVYNMSFSCIPTTSLSDGAHTMRIRATDCDNNITASTDYTQANFVIDTQLPQISSATSSHNNTSAEISWTTDERSSSLVQYGKTTSYGDATSEKDTLIRVYDHKIALSELDECTTYHYRVKSKDAAGNQAVSDDYTFKTNDSLGAPDINESVVNGSSSITVKFDTAPGTIDNYEIAYGKSEGSYPFGNDNIGGADINKYTVSSLDSGTTYYFRIRAINSCGKGDWSNVASATTTSAQSDSESPTEESSASQTDTSDNLTTSKSEPTPTPPATYNDTMDTNWQLRFFGSAYCQDISKCGPDADPDNDGVSNADEYRLGTNPNEADTDNDGLDDSTEIEMGKNPSKSPDEPGGDEIKFQSAKESGQTVKDKYEVKNVELKEDSGGNKKLLISGQAPPNSYVTIYVYSDLPTILHVKTDENGNWSYELDKQLADGEHQVYVAVTDSSGQVLAKSEPLFFVKTAEAVTVIPPAEAANSGVSVTKKRTYTDMFYYFILGILGLIIALVGIGLSLKKIRGKQNNVNT